MFACCAIAKVHVAAGLGPTLCRSASTRICMRRRWIVINATVASLLLGGMVALSAPQSPAVRSVDEKVLREYTGVYRWASNAFLYLQMWNEFSGFTKPSQLVAFDESGEIRTLYPTVADQFFAGPGGAVQMSVESHIEFQRDGSGTITSLMWRREGVASRTARRVEIEKREDVRFPSGDLQLTGTIISPITEGKHPVPAFRKNAARMRSWPARMPARRRAWLTLLLASTRLFAGGAFKARDRAQVRVDGCDLTVRHVLKRRPGHDLQL